MALREISNNQQKVTFQTHQAPQHGELSPHEREPWTRVAKLLACGTHDAIELGRTMIEHQGLRSGPAVRALLEQRPERVGACSTEIDRLDRMVQGALAEINALLK